MDNGKPVSEVLVSCYSENTYDSIECYIEVSSTNPSADDIDLDDIIGSLEECFWELLFEFEDSAQKAYDNGVISGIDYDELFKVFGHFRFSCTVDEEPININLEIDPDEFMYTRLVEYLVINEK